MDSGYLLMGTDRPSVLRAINTRANGSPLIRSSVFRNQLPASAGVHQSAWVWVNTQGALSMLDSFAPPQFKPLLDSHDPILGIFNAGTERIDAVSRTRLTSVLFDLVLSHHASPTANAPTRN